MADLKTIYTTYGLTAMAQAEAISVPMLGWLHLAPLITEIF